MTRQRLVVITCDNCGNETREAEAAVLITRYEDRRRGEKKADLCGECAAKMPGSSTTTRRGAATNGARIDYEELEGRVLAGKNGELAEGFTRAEIAERFNLTKDQGSRIVSKLVEQGKIRETAETRPAAGGVGMPAKIYAFVD